MSDLSRKAISLPTLSNTNSSHASAAEERFRSLRGSIDSIAPEIASLYRPTRKSDDRRRHVVENKDETPRSKPKSTVDEITNQLDRLEMELKSLDAHTRATGQEILQSVLQHVDSLPQTLSVSNSLMDIRKTKSLDGVLPKPTLKIVDPRQEERLRYAKAYKATFTSAGRIVDDTDVIRKPSVSSVTKSLDYLRVLDDEDVMTASAADDGAIGVPEFLKNNGLHGSLESVEETPEEEESILDNPSERSFVPMTPNLSMEAPQGSQQSHMYQTLSLTSLLQPSALSLLHQINTRRQLTKTQQRKLVERLTKERNYPMSYQRKRDDDEKEKEKKKKAMNKSDMKKKDQHVKELPPRVLKPTKASLHKLDQQKETFNGYPNGFKPIEREKGLAKAKEAKKLQTIEWFNDFAPWLVEKRLREEEEEKQMALKAQEERMAQIRQRAGEVDYVGIADAVELA